MSLFPALTADPGDGLALAFADRSLSYRELSRAAHRVAAELEGAHRVAVLAEPRIETAVAVIGALLAGVPAVPINPKSGRSELDHIAGDADPDALAIAPGAEVPDALDGRRVVVVELDAPATGDGVSPARVPSDEDPALIVYTSGTTGRPKGARHAPPRDRHQPRRAGRGLGLDRARRRRPRLPLFHVHGLVIGILGPLRRGGGALHLGRFSIAGRAVGRCAEADAGDDAVRGPDDVPPAGRGGEADPVLARALAGARLLGFRIGGAACRRARAAHAADRRDGARALRHDRDADEHRHPVGGRAAPGTVGPPLPGVELRLVDDDGEVMAGEDDETIGEVQVRGPNLFLGYLNRADATAAAMTDDGWFITGDMATRGAGGYIRLVGRRATDLIKSGGYKIGAGEIEGCAARAPGGRRRGRHRRARRRPRRASSPGSCSATARTRARPS